MSSTTSSGKCSRAHEIEDRRLRVDAGEHDRGRERLAVDQRHAGHTAAGDVDRRHRRVRAHHGTEGPCAGRDRLRDRAHAAAHVAPRTPYAVQFAEFVVQQVVGRAGRARAGPHADHAGRRVRALERVVLEPVVEQVADRHRHHAIEVLQPAAREPRGPAGLLQQVEHVARVARAERRRRAQHHRAQDVGDALHHRLERRHPVGVARRDRRQRRARLLGVVVEQDRAPVGREGRERRVERDRVVAEALELEVGDDLRAQHADHVGRARDALPWPDLLGHARAAQQLPALEHAHAQAGPRQVRRRGQPVVAAAGDDRVEVGAHCSASR